MINGSRWRSTLLQLLGGDLGTLLALIVVVLFFTSADYIQNGEDAMFASVRNLRHMTTQTSIVAVAALGMTMIIIATHSVTAPTEKNAIRLRCRRRDARKAT